MCVHGIYVDEYHNPLTTLANCTQPNKKYEDQVMWNNYGIEPTNKNDDNDDYKDRGKVIMQERKGKQQKHPRLPVNTTKWRSSSTPKKKKKNQLQNESGNTARLH
eukprot:13661146-Ditylum_brightwellii.AAC.1